MDIHVQTEVKRNHLCAMGGQNVAGAVKKGLVKPVTVNPRDWEEIQVPWLVDLCLLNALFHLGFKSVLEMCKKKKKPQKVNQALRKSDFAILYNAGEE